ncbi:MAG: branched-chain amino acid ABC transporter permease, partial [Mesorhizobium sp.]
MKSFLTLLAALLALCALGFLLGSYESDVYRKLLLWIALGLSFNFLFGISGQVAFSHFVFLGFGAY